MSIPSQYQKQLARLGARQIAHAESVAADNNNGKGYRKPGSMNRRKSWPVGDGKPREKRR